MQKNRQYCSHFAFGNYFGEMGDLDGPLLLVPALRPDVYQKFNEFNRIYHMDVRVAGLESARKLVGEGHGVATLLGLMNNLQSPTLKVEFGVGRGGGTMSASTAKTYLRRILRWLSKEEHFVEKLKVRGSPNLDTPPEVLDLIKDRLVDDVEVDMDEDRRISFQKRGNALKELWRKRRKDLVQLFEAP